MARSCQVCGKGFSMGNTVTLRGKAKYLGGVGTKVTGISRRKFKPNLQRLRITTGRGTSTTALVCTQCIKGGKVTKLVKQAPFRLDQATVHLQLLEECKEHVHALNPGPGPATQNRCR
ncbi:MAG: 50S ribosomal protein L28, partial [Planctomycetia bacterium]